jgi:hypothetical protein
VVFDPVSIEMRMNNTESPFAFSISELKLSLHIMPSFNYYASLSVKSAI